MILGLRLLVQQLHCMFPEKSESTGVAKASPSAFPERHWRVEERAVFSLVWRAQSRPACPHLLSHCLCTHNGEAWCWAQGHCAGAHRSSGIQQELGTVSAVLCLTVLLLVTEVLWCVKLVDKALARRSAQRCAGWRRQEARVPGCPGDLL